MSDPVRNVPSMSPAPESSASRGRKLPWYSPRSWVLRLAAPIVVLGALAGWMYWSTTNVPQESNRVQHPIGYSIVKPRGWSAKMQTAPSETFRDGITLEPEKWVSLEPRMWARRYLWPPDIQKLRDAGYVAGDFQGRAAWLSQQKPRRRITRTAIFQDAGEWYQIGVDLPGLEGARIEDWWKFPLSFRPAASASPANQPSTAPTATPSTSQS